MNSLPLESLPSLDSPDGPSMRLKSLSPLVEDLYTISALAERPYHLNMETRVANARTEVRNVNVSRVCLDTSTGTENIRNRKSESLQVCENVGVNKDEPECDINAAEFVAYSREESTYKNRIVSWDTLRPGYPQENLYSPFLTEQSPSIVTAACCAHSLDSYYFTRTKVIRFKISELIDSLSSTFAGCSSDMHIWDAKEERFILKYPYSEDLAGRDSTVRIVLDGVDDKICEEYVDSCVMYGTLLRRLEIYITRLRKKVKHAGSTVFAFAYALSSALVWVKRTMSDYLSSLGSGGKSKICDGEPYSLLEDPDGRFQVYQNPELNPDAYKALPSIPTGLLSHIYEFLFMKIEQHAPRVIRAILSYILSITSRPYLQHIGQAVGLENLQYTLNFARKKAQRILDEVASAPFGEVNEEADEDLVFEDDGGNGMISTNETFPSFMSDEAKEAILRARRSIRILSSPELRESEAPKVPELHKLEWVWTDKDINMRTTPSRKGELDMNEVPANLNAVTDDPTIDGSVRSYKPELAGLAVFDLQPGSKISDGLLVSQSPGVNEISSFINSYPDHLPSLTSTLPLLASFILSPITLQAAILGQSALRIFFDPGSTLHFRAHIVFLRAYILLGSPEFKSRLSAALFSDSEVQDDGKAEENTMAMTIRTRNRNQNWRKVRAKKNYGTLNVKHEDHNDWAVGLAHGLTDREEWPPGGSDLSFYLRRVIMDSLKSVRAVGDVNHNQETNENRSLYDLGVDEFWDEAESRLGFAIRDLPIGTGRDKWLDPTCIEALDFLTMDYKPPRPLNCLITADILSKYQRIFTFLLRLLRVENVMRLLYRLSRPSAQQQLFKDPAAENLFRHFRFAAQVFVSVFSAYIADTAIGGNLNAFLARLRTAESEASIAYSSSCHSLATPESLSADIIRGLQEYSTEPDSARVETAVDDTALTYSRYFADVYALMQKHSRALDDILAACLLRTAQRAIGDILRTCLELALEFAVLVGNVFCGLVEQDVAFERMTSLYAKFHSKITVLIKALKKNSDNNNMAQSMDTPAWHGKEDRLPSAPGGMEALSNLLLRLGDVSNVFKAH